MVEQTWSTEDREKLWKILKDIGIGMYEAWKLNKHMPIVISGPHAIAPSPVAPAAAAAPAAS